MVSTSAGAHWRSRSSQQTEPLVAALVHLMYHPVSRGIFWGVSTSHTVLDTVRASGDYHPPLGALNS